MKIYAKFELFQTFRHGISYLNKSQEENLREELLSGSLMRATERNLSLDEEDEIEDVCKKIKLQPDNCKNIIQMGQKGLSPGAKYVLHEEVKARFPDLSPLLAKVS